MNIEYIPLELQNIAATTFTKIRIAREAQSILELDPEANTLVKESESDPTHCLVENFPSPALFIVLITR